MFKISSKKRIKPICKFYGGCTGCQWQHISYDEQLKLKKSNIVKLLRNFNLIDVGFVMDTLPSKNNFNYRNQARFTVRKDFDKEKLGFINFLNREWIGIDECKIMNHTINEKMKIIANEIDFKIYDLLFDFESIESKKLWNKYNDPHPNEIGHKIMGETIYNILTQ